MPYTREKYCILVVEKVSINFTETARLYKQYGLLESKTIYTVLHVYKIPCTLSLICLSESVTKMEEVGSLALILVWAPWRAGKKVEWISAGFRQFIRGATSRVIRKYGSLKIGHTWFTYNNNNKQTIIRRFLYSLGFFHLRRFINTCRILFLGTNVN